MKIRLVEELYVYDEDGYKVEPISDIMDVTEEEYNTLKYLYSIRVLKDKDWFLEKASKEEKRQKDLEKKYAEESAKRKAKAAETSEKRKLAQLEKLKKELGLEDSIS